MGIGDNIARFLASVNPEGIASGLIASVNHACCLLRDFVAAVFVYIGE